MHRVGQSPSRGTIRSAIVQSPSRGTLWDEIRPLHAHGGNLQILINNDSFLLHVATDM